MAVEYYYRESTVTQSLVKWRMLTGNQDNPQVSDEDLAKQFIPVVYKMVRKGTAELGPWMVLHSDGSEEELQDSALEERLEETIDHKQQFRVELIDVAARGLSEPEFSASYEVLVLPEEGSPGRMAAWVFGGIAAVVIGVVFLNSRK